MLSWYHRLWRFVSRAPSPPQPLPAGQRKRLRPKVEVLERRCLPSHLPTVTFSFVVPAGTPNEVIGPGTVLAVLNPEGRQEAKLFRFLQQHHKDLVAIMRWQEGGTVQVDRVRFHTLRTPSQASTHTAVEKQVDEGRFRMSNPPSFVPLPIRPTEILSNGGLNTNPDPTAGFGPGLTQVTLQFRPPFSFNLPGFLGPEVVNQLGLQLGQAFAGWFLGTNINVGGVGGINVGGVGGINIGGFQVGGINIGNFLGFGSFG
jgi:hypothetical protein